MITFLYKKRPDDTYVIEHQGNPYHVIPDDPLFEECVEEYVALEQEPPDEPVPEPPPVMHDPMEDPMAKLLARIEKLEKSRGV
jgi:hypothetical protein